MNFIETILRSLQKIVNTAAANYANSKNDINLFGGAILATNILMWAYSVVVISYVDAVIAKYICTAVTIIHSLGLVSLFFLARERFNL